MKKKDVVLFSPLNWGLGHATRIVPLIKEEQKNGNNVLVAAGGRAFDFFCKEFKDIKIIYFPNFNVSYWRKPFFNLGLLIQMPLFFVSIFVEHFFVKKIIKKHNITKVISDNRYGVFYKKIKNIIVTHQLFIKLPFLFKVFEPFLHFITRKLVNVFDECWVPDYADLNKSLSKELSHGKKIPKNVKYIGPLSRFSDYSIVCNDFCLSSCPDILAIISGPEPSRTIFEKEVEKRFANTDKKVLMVCGKPEEASNEVFGNIKKVSHLDSKTLLFYLKNSDNIISRCGYSTLMDLHILGLQAELSATPKQPEQEYLLSIN